MLLPRTGINRRRATLRAARPLSLPFGNRFEALFLALFLELHINAAASDVDTSALLSGGNADYHSGLIRHECAGLPSAKSHAARALATDIIMPVKVLKMLEVENLAVSGRAGNPDLAYGHSLYFNWIGFAFVRKGSAPGAEADPYRDRLKR
jgi:hypothetical protein